MAMYAKPRNQKEAELMSNPVQVTAKPMTKPIELVHFKYTGGLPTYPFNTKDGVSYIFNKLKETDIAHNAIIAVDHIKEMLLDPNLTVSIVKRAISQAHFNYAFPHIEEGVAIVKALLDKKITIAQAVMPELTDEVKKLIGLTSDEEEAEAPAPKKPKKPAAPPA